MVGLATWMKISAAACGAHDGVHAGLAGQAIALAPIAGRARGDDVLPAGGAALGARDHVIDGQVGARATVLAHPAIPANTARRVILRRWVSRGTLT